MTEPSPSLAARLREDCANDHYDHEAEIACCDPLAPIHHDEWCNRCLAAEALEAKDHALARAAKLVEEWRETARLARPLECATITVEKRRRIEKWMFYSNRASELEAALRERR